MPAEQYPADWDDRRRKVYQRDGYECQLCHAQGGQVGDTELHAHHVTPISEGGSHDLDNLVTLCKSCHNDQHDHDITGGDQPSPTSTTSGQGGTVGTIFAQLISAVFVSIFYYAILGALLATGAEYGVFEFIIMLALSTGLAWGAGRFFASSTIGYSYVCLGLVSVFHVATADGGINAVWDAVRISNMGDVFAPLVVDLSMITMLVIPLISKLSMDDSE